MNVCNILVSKDSKVVFINSPIYYTTPLFFEKNLGLRDEGYLRKMVHIELFL